MVEYRLRTIWRFEAPLEVIYAAIHDAPRWPDWWPGVKKVELVETGNADGINSVLRYCLHGRLPYRMTFLVRATRIEPQVSIEGTVQGDLAGIGRWHFTRQGELTIVEYEWHVLGTRWWMNLIAQFARAMFIRNHNIVMQEGAQGLARQLGVTLVSEETVDLMTPAQADPNRPQGGQTVTAVGSRSRPPSVGSLSQVREKNH